MTYVILTHIRSGSTLLGDLLTRNGLGPPCEHLNPDVGLRERFADPVRVIELARLAVQSCGQNFGSKVMVHWLDGLKQAANLSDRTDDELLRVLFGADCSVVCLRRDDVLGSALSLTRVALTGEWRRLEDEESVEIRAGLGWSQIRELIHHNLAWLDGCVQRLRTFRDTTELPVVDIRYENLVSDTAGAVRAVVRAVQGYLPAKVVTHASFRRQADQVSAQWRDRFLAEAAASPRNLPSR